MGQEPYRIKRPTFATPSPREIERSPISHLLRRLPALPRHPLVNKVAMRDETTIVTLENFGVALVPYQIRNREAFLSEMANLGYRIEDE